MTTEHRRRWRFGLIESAIFLVFAALVWFGLGMHRGLLLSSDIKTVVYPWAGTFSQHESQAMVLADSVQQLVPWLQFARNELAAGRLPLWNPHQDGGVPLLGNPQSVLLSPFSLPSLLFRVEHGWNPGLLLKLLVAFSGAYLWLRNLGRERMSATLGGVMFALSGAFIAWLEHPISGSAAWTPWLLLAISRLAACPRPIHWLGVAFTTFLVIAGGHPETVLMVAMLAAAVLANTARSWPARTRVVTSALIGAGLAAPLLVPFFEYLRLSSAAAGEGRSRMVLDLSTLLRFILPKSEIGHPIEAAATVSIIGLALTGVGLMATWTKRELRFWALVPLIILVFAYQNPLSSLLAEHTPVYWTRGLLILPLPMAVLASAGLERTIVWVRGTGRPSFAFAIGVVLTVVATGELIFAARGVHAVTSPNLVSPTTPLLEYLAKDSDVFRIAPLGEFLPPNLATVAGLDDIRGYDALGPRGWHGQRESIGHFIQGELHPGTLAPQGAGLDFWNVKYLLISPKHRLIASDLSRTLNLDLEEVYRGTDGTVWRNNRCQPRLRIGISGSIQWLSRTPTRWSFQATNSKPTQLVIANPFFPGWRLRVDGQLRSITAAPGEAITLPLDTGSHQIEFFYRPLTVWIGLGIALIAVVSLGLACWLSHIDRTRGQNQ